MHLVTIPQLANHTGWTRQVINKWLRLNKKDLPPLVTLTERKRGWELESINKWLEERNFRPMTKEDLLCKA